MAICTLRRSTLNVGMQLNTCRTPAQDLGMVLFLAISGSLFHNVAVDKVGEALPGLASTDIGNLIAGTSSTIFPSLSEPDKSLVIPQLATAMKSVWASFMAAAVLSFVCSFQLLVGLPSDIFDSSRH